MAGVLRATTSHSAQNVQEGLRSSGTRPRAGARRCGLEPTGRTARGGGVRRCLLACRPQRPYTAVRAIRPAWSSGWWCSRRGRLHWRAPSSTWPASSTQPPYRAACAPTARARAATFLSEAVTLCIQDAILVSRLQPHVSRCVDCSGAGQAVFGQGGDLGYSLSLSATGARVRLPGAGSDGMRSAAAASDASAQYPNLAIVRWRVEFTGGIKVFANGELLGGTDLGALPALSLSELGNLDNLTLGTADTSSASDFFSGTALEAATPSARGCSPMCCWLQPSVPRLCPYVCRASG